MGHTRRAQRRALLGVLSMVAAAACGGGGSGAAGGSAAGGTVTLRATEFKFEPATIRIAADKPVRLVLVNVGQIEHDVVIEGLAAKDIRASEAGREHAGKLAAHAQPGKQARVEFTPTTKGTYDIVCTIPGHKDAGMRGRVIVE